MVAGPTLNSWTSGEISDDAWDRNDIQPITKGCKEATNLVMRIAGPLGKRRGFWRVSAVADQARGARMIPFRRSIDDALMLEFGNLVVRVWQADGSPLLNLGVQVQFASPYADTDLPLLRYKQVADVIYFRTRTGLTPHTLVRNSDSSWSFNVETFPDGPWLAENQNPAFTLTVTGPTSEADTTASTGAGSMAAGQVVNLVAAQALFSPDHVGGCFRLRQNDGAPGVKTWSTGFRPALTNYCASAGRVYACTTVGVGPLTSGVDQAVTTPPVVTAGAQSDGGNIWTYRHDGAGVVRILTVADATHATATVLAAIPFQTGQATSVWAEGAYSAYRGLPRMWPSVVEERVVSGATNANLDMLDLTATAGFDTVSETFAPGLGNGTVVDTDAMRRRVGDDGSELIWSQLSTFLLVGTASGEYIASSGLFGTPLAPSTIVVRQLSDYGSADVYPVRAHTGLFFVTRGGQAVRKLKVDLQQNATGDDMSFLAKHIGARVFAQLAWVPWPDEVLWARLGDGGLAAMTNHEEQQVRGWTRQQIPGGFVVEDVVTLPGPGRLETLWMIVSRLKNGVSQRHIWMQSQTSDALFIDGAEFYQGAPVTTVGGLAHYEGETARVIADGAMYDLPVTGGAVTLKTAASTVQVGLGYQTRFESLTLDQGVIAAALNLRQRVTQMLVHLKTVLAQVGVPGGLFETVSTRTAQTVPAAVPQTIVDQTTVGIGTMRSPTVVVTDDTAYDHVIYSLKPSVAVGG